MPLTSDRRDDLTKITEFAKGAVDTAVGLGVLGLQKLQVGRVELQKHLIRHETLGAGYSGLRSETLRRVSHLDALIGGALRTVESSLHPVTERLPGPARHVATVAQARIDDLHAKIGRFLAEASREAASPKADTDTDPAA
jgi:hypothetical protein